MLDSTLDKIVNDPAVRKALKRYVLRFIEQKGSSAEVEGRAVVQAVINAERERMRRAT
jgi:hypothetical protein